jgi:hypothetical protein
MLTPDSAVAIAAKSEQQTLHSEANRLLLLSGQHTSVALLMYPNSITMAAKKQKRL